MKHFRLLEPKVLRAALFLLLGVIAAAFLGCFSVPFTSVQYEPGLYEGSGRGFRGPITVRLLVSASGIDDIEILDHREDNAIGGAAIDELREQILESGISADMAELDAVSGATASRRGFLEALENALLKAKH